jgi:hypothetical protein
MIEQYLAFLLAASFMNAIMSGLYQGCVQDLLQGLEIGRILRLLTN